MSKRQVFLRMLICLKKYIPAYTICTIIYNSQRFAFAFLNGLFLQRATEGILAGDLSQVMVAIRFMLISLILVLLVVGVGVYIYILIHSYVLRDITMKLFNAFMRTSAEAGRHSGEGVSKLNTDARLATDAITYGLNPIFTSVITAAFSTVTIMIINWQMGIVAIGIGILVFFVQSRFSTPFAKIGKKQLDVNEEAVKAVSNFFSGSLTIRAFNRQKSSFLQFDTINKSLKALEVKRAIWEMWQNAFTTVQGWVTMVSVFAIGGWFVATERMEFPQVLFFLNLFIAIESAMSNIGSAFANLQPSIIAASRVLSIIDTIPKSSTLQNIESLPCNDGYDLHINELCFSYRDTDSLQISGETTLNGITLEIKENQMVAFIGESGSGKSTLLRAIIGMYERSDLNMTIGARKYSPQNMNQWRKAFAYVDQSCRLFNMTVGDNIAMGLGGKMEEKVIKNAASRAFAHDFISELPDGYATICGEAGIRFSEGQRQRIALARAICRNSPILVFDEITSALDAENERNILETIESLRNDHTILMTTHNIESIATADLIVVMDNGTIAEMGTHEELVKKGSLYAKLLEVK
ncbi:MAG: ABC transporter ATP-binding protein/permease [Defluviitaleaceae bacterium]|nr:ABC transporter ATP-binding protein/permease [Defluviitaleaceae bacterium]MCL2274121.1 ABC transporter ATP-binding protein/permease [Defluviitaleaceae bacterium]